MSSPSYSIVYSAVVSGAAAAGGAGTVLIPDTTTGLYVVATTTNRGTRRSTGVALTSFVPGGTVEIQQVGQLDATTAGLGAGTASWVRVSATGALERVTPGSGDDIVGRVEADGTFHALFGILDTFVTGGGGGFTPPTGTGLVTVTSGALDAAATALGTGIPAWLTTPSSANLLAALTTKTGAGNAVFHNAPILTTPQINNVGGTFQYIINPAAIAANRTISLPLLTANDTFCTLAFAQTLTNKSIDASSNPITNIANASISASAAIAVSKLAPAGTNGWVLTTTGGVPVWAAAAGGSGSPGGSSGQMQWNNAGAFGGADMTYVSGTGYQIATNGTGIYMQDTGANNRFMVGVDSGNYLQVGLGFLQAAYGADDLILGTVFGQVMRASTTAAAFAVPLEGNLYGAVDGQTVIAVSGSNITLSQAQYGAGIQKFTGALGATRTITYPLPASDAASYKRVIWGQTTGFGLSISNGSGLTVNTVVNDAPHLCIFTPTGVIRIT